VFAAQTLVLSITGWHAGNAVQRYREDGGGSEKMNMRDFNLIS